MLFREECLDIQEEVIRVGRVVDIQVQGLVLLLGVILDRLQDKAIQASLALLPAKVIQAKLLLVKAIQDKLHPAKVIQSICKQLHRASHTTQTLMLNPRTSRQRNAVVCSENYSINAQPQ